ncbi:putative MFS-type transporter PB1E7.08c [Favolaschia claudopus]|uniref:MFS-type transporter PB1E7.08c n=1 Tax=Favolaschia claudopus TaxID=2862362 RepID=A0AAW0E6N6_9AGAR
MLNADKSTKEKQVPSTVHLETMDHAVDAIYQAKARILNNALQDIGMGRYQWAVFVVTGFGWLSDNLWQVVVALILVPVINEFHAQGPFLKLSQNIGLLVGAAFWGASADVWGRRLAFNLTLLIIGIFGVAVGASPNFVTLCALTATLSVGAGGNFPVASSILIETVPPSHQYLLTVISIWASLGDLSGSLVALALIGNYSCTPPECSRASNEGWRYFLYIMGGLTILLWAIRFFVFDMHESPKYLIGTGKDEEAVAAIHKIAEYNGKTSNLSVEDLKAQDRIEREQDSITVTAALRHQFSVLNSDHLRPLFATRKLAHSTGLLTLIWGSFNCVLPLKLHHDTYNSFVPYYLSTRGATFGDGSTYITYRNTAIMYAASVPAGPLTGYLVEVPLLGRRGTLAISAALAGVLILLSTTSRTSNALLGWNCAFEFTVLVMYSVLYGLSPELFPTKDRGTGNALVASAHRGFGVISPIIALYADLTTSVPIFVAGALLVVVGLLALLLPFESRGRAAL